MPGRGVSILEIGRETVVVVLAFVAGVGGYAVQAQGDWRWPHDYLGAAGAGALLSLAKMIPTGRGKG